MEAADAVKNNVVKQAAVATHATSMTSACLCSNDVAFCGQQLILAVNIGVGIGRGENCFCQQLSGMI